MNWDTALREYEMYLTLEKSLSKHTIENYLRDIKKIQDYTPNLPTNITQEYLQDFVHDYAKKDYSPRSQARLISSLKSFFDFLVLDDYTKINPATLLESPKLGMKLPDTLSVEEINQIIHAIDLSHPQGQRNRAILETLYGCGLRVSELVNLKLSDLYFDEDFIKVTGKGNKTRLVPIAKSTQKQINLYIDHDRIHQKTQPKAEDILFLNRRGNLLTRVMIFTIIKQLTTKANIKKSVSPHSFRHSYASHLLQRGANLRAIQQMLGHESITTTEVYTHLNQQHLRDTILLYHPRKNINY